jgi:hypothetical protein
MNREAIYSALFAKLAAIHGVRMCSRRLKGWSDVPATEQPALFMVQSEEEPDQEEGRPPIWRLSVDVYVYCNVGRDPFATPATEMNGIIDQIESAIAGTYQGQPQTLGGLVTHCWIDGKIETDGGALDAQAVAIVPITMMAV